MPARRVRGIRLLLVMAVLVSRTAMAQGGGAEVSSALRSGTLSFLGRATVGAFVGSTSEVSGVVVGDLLGARGWIEASVASLTTHNDHRDRDLRAAMEVDRYPTMRFDLDSAVMVAPGEAARNGVDVRLHGRLAIHGVTHVVELPAAVSRRGDTLQVHAVFPLDVTDYRVGGLNKAFGILRMRRQIEVRADLRFVRATEQPRSLTSSRQERFR